MATAAELDALKASWIADPHWDIEHTEGFEAHVAELTIYRLDVEARQQAAERKRQAARMVALGIPENPLLLDYLESLERRIRNLEREVYALANPNP